VGGLGRVNTAATGKDRSTKQCRRQDGLKKCHDFMGRDTCGEGSVCRAERCLGEGETAPYCLGTGYDSCTNPPGERSNRLDLKKEEHTYPGGANSLRNGKKGGQDGPNACPSV